MIRLFHLFVHVIYIVMTDGEPYTSEYEYYSDAVGWLKIHLTPATWRDVRAKCVEEGAILASPDTQNMAAAMTTTILSSALSPMFVYTGIHDTYSKGFFYSVEGTPLSELWARWAPGEPDDVDNDENCVTMHRNGQLHDNSCTEMYPFICYKREPVTGANQCGPEDLGYVFEQRTGSCYKFHLVRSSWARAFAQCSREGAHLAVINSDVEAEVIRDLFAYTRVMDIAHIGFTDSGNHTSTRTSTWMTIHGQTLKQAGYERWAQGEPQQTGTHCGAVFEDGLLDDYFCDVELPFICEMTKPRNRNFRSNKKKP